jgi:Uma2 family endonuclease
VKWTSGRLDKLEVYRRLGVEEVWWWEEGTITVFARAAEGYREVARSPLLPDLDVNLLASFLDRPTLTHAVREFRAATTASKG